MDKLFNIVRESAARDLTLFGMRVFILIWALFVVLLSFFIDNKWILAGIIAYEVLP